MRSLLLAALLLVTLGLSPRSVGAQGPLPSVTATKVTANFDGVSIRRALATLFQQAGARYSVEPDVPNTAITVRLKQMEFGQALRVVTLLAGVSYAWEGDRCVIKNGRAAIGSDPPPQPIRVDEEPRVTLQFRNLPLRRALADLFRVAGRQFAVEPAVPDAPVTLSLKEIEFTTALRTLTRLAGVTYWKEGIGAGIYVIGVRLAEGAPPVAQAPPAAIAPRDGEPKVTLNLANVPIRQAIEQLFRGTGRQYAIEPNVPNTPVTLNVREMDFTTALRTMLRLAGLTYRKEGVIYVVGERLPPAPPEQAAGRKLDIDLREVPFRLALETLFRDTGHPYAVQPEVPNIPITLRVRQIDFDSVVRTVSRLGRAELRREGALYLFAVPSVPAPPADGVVPRKPVSAPVEPPDAIEPAGTKVSLMLESVPLREALAALFHAAKAKYRLDPDTPDIPITVQIREVDFATVLRTVTRLGGATYSREGDNYVIRAR